MWKRVNTFLYSLMLTCDVTYQSVAHAEKMTQFCTVTMPWTYAHHNRRLVRPTYVQVSCLNMGASLAQKWSTAILRSQGVNWSSSPTGTGCNRHEMLVSCALRATKSLFTKRWSHLIVHLTLIILFMTTSSKAPLRDITHHISFPAGLSTLRTPHGMSWWLFMESKMRRSDA